MHPKGRGAVRWGRGRGQSIIVLLQRVHQLKSLSEANEAKHLGVLELPLRRVLLAEGRESVQPVVYGRSPQAVQESPHSIASAAVTLRREVRRRLQSSERLAIVPLGLQPAEALLREAADAAENNQFLGGPLGDGCNKAHPR